LDASLIATKMFLPRTRPELVARQRLNERLSHSAHYRLTLVSGPAGFGKTTLIATWLADAVRRGDAVAWLALDASDDEPERFWRYVVTALDGAAPGVAPDALRLAKATPTSAERVVTVLVNELAAATSDVWLVLDDYHTLRSEAVHDGVAFLLDHVSARTHLVIITRADPELPLARWRVRDELLEFRDADLRFTLDETSAFLNGVSRLNLSVTDVEALSERTEGWVAALQLAALSLQGRDKPSDFIARFAGNDKYVVEYLVDEVLAHQDNDVRTFLLCTAVLDRLTGALCDAITGRNDGQLMLARLERANLFLFRLDSHGEWYRYHHLFADVLRVRLNQQRGEEVGLLHQSASQWYEDNNAVEESVRHALDARDFKRATRLMETALAAIRRNRQDALLMGWLRALPDEAVRLSPVLSVFYGWMLMITGDLSRVEARLDDATSMLAAAPDEVRARWAQTDELRSLPATIAVYRASLAQALGRTSDTVLHARHALDLAGPDDHLARGAATGFLGLASWARGDVTMAVRTFAEAVENLRAAGNTADALGSTVVLADMWLAAGRLHVARGLYDESIAAAEAQGVSFAQTSALLHVGLSEIDLEAGDVAKARWHLDTALALDDHMSLTANHFRWFLAMGRVADAQGDFKAAVERLEQAQSLYRQGFFVDVRPIPAVTARVRISHGQLHRAERWAQGLDWSTTDPDDYLVEFDHLTYVRLLLAQHRAYARPTTLDQAAQLLNRLLQPATRLGRWGSVVEIHMLTALVRDAQDNRTNAIDSLAAAFASAPDSDGYARLFLAEGEPMRTLLRQAQHLGVADGHPERILAGLDRATPSHALVDPLSKREMQVLRLLDSELSGPEVARQLFVSHNTVRTHTRHIFAKLQVSTRRAAVLRAGELGLL
jgi:LuxR family maltose regulon positive regulatory protein